MTHQSVLTHQYFGDCTFFRSSKSTNPIIKGMLSSHAIWTAFNPPTQDFRDYGDKQRHSDDRRTIDWDNNRVISDKSFTDSKTTAENATMRRKVKHILPKFRFFRVFISYISFVFQKLLRTRLLFFPVWNRKAVQLRHFQGFLSILSEVKNCLTQKCY